MKLVKFDCGCVGSAPYTSAVGAEISWLVWQCDANDEAVLVTQDMIGEAFETIDQDEANEKYLEPLRTLIRDGYRHRAIRALLGVK